MRKLQILGTGILTFLFFAVGYAVEFLNSFLAVLFDLPGPYPDSPIAWVWFGFNLLVIVGISFVFCRWYGKQNEMINNIADAFE